VWHPANGAPDARSGRRVGRDTTLTYTHRCRRATRGAIDRPALVRDRWANRRADSSPQATGADLIYINETRASFVLVQYKSFRNEESNGASRLVYRPDAQLAAELERMHKIKPGKRDGTLGTYRLHRGCCYLKICKPVVRVDHPADELVTGMYLPLDYYDELVASDDVKGPRDGVALSYATVARYLNNDLFVQLVRGAWIGSRGATTKRLTGIALAGLAADRSVTIAAASLEAPTV